MMTVIMIMMVMIVIKMIPMLSKFTIHYDHVNQFLKIIRCFTINYQKEGKCLVFHFDD